MVIAAKSVCNKLMRPCKLSASRGNRLEFLKWVTLLFSKWSLRSLREGGRQRGRSSGYCSRSSGISRVLRDEGWGLGDRGLNQPNPIPALALRAAVLRHTTRGQKITFLYTFAHHTAGCTLAPQFPVSSPPYFPDRETEA